MARLAAAGCAYFLLVFVAGLLAGYALGSGPAPGRGEIGTAASATR